MIKGILGGSFNPPHLGHLALARAVLESGRVDRVVLLPAWRSPHKLGAEQAEPAERLHMTRLLASLDGRLEVDDGEIARSGPSYTIDTVRELRRRSEDGFRLVLGSDLLAGFFTWREPRELLRLAPPLVAERPDAPLPDDLAAVPGMPEGMAAIFRDGVFSMPPVDSSSTKVRGLIRSGAPRPELLRHVPETVLDYIRSRRLYGTGSKETHDERNQTHRIDRP